MMSAYAFNILFWSLRILGIGMLLTSFELLFSPRLLSAFSLNKSNVSIKILLFLRVFLIILVEYLSFSQFNNFPNYWQILTLIMGITWLVNLSFYWCLGGVLSGGSDSLLNLSLLTIFLSLLFKDARIGIYFIAVQSFASYFISGVIKIKERSWRKGQALSQFLIMTIFEKPRWLIEIYSNSFLMRSTSWLIIVLELILPFSCLLKPSLTIPVLLLGGIFHCCNAYLFGINRFILIWLSTYPCLWWIVNLQ